VKRYYNEGRETALALLRSKQYDALEEYLLETVVYQRQRYDAHYEWLQNHGIGKMYKEEDAIS